MNEYIIIVTGNESEKKQLMLILTTILRNIIDSQSQHKKSFLSDLIETFSQQIIIDQKNEENIRLHLAIIKHYIIALDSDAFKNSKHLKYVKKIHKDAVTNPENLDAHMQSLKMLPLLYQQESLNEYVLSITQEIVSKSFETKSVKAYEAGTSHWQDYVARLDCLLDNIILTQSFELIKACVSVLTEKNPKYINKINEKMDILVCDLIGKSNEKACLQFVDKTVCYL